MLKHEGVRYTHKINDDRLLCDKRQNGFSSLFAHFITSEVLTKWLTAAVKRKKHLYHSWMFI